MKAIHESLTEERIVALMESSLYEVDLSDIGVCTACGEDAHGVEPDARGYSCEACGESAVCGASELFESYVM